MPSIESPAAAALNHLLGAEPWARERLARFAGEAFELRLPLAPALRFAIAGDGSVGPAPDGAPVALVLTLEAGALPALFRGEDHFMRAVDVSGNARLANEVLFLVRNLRWDAEEDLSRLFGDAAAHRIAGAVRTLAGWQADAARRIAEAFMEYAIEERGLLVRRAELDGLARRVAQLRDALERIEKRLERLPRG